MGTLKLLESKRVEVGAWVGVWACGLCELACFSKSPLGALEAERPALGEVVHSNTHEGL